MGASYDLLVIVWHLSVLFSGRCFACLYCTSLRPCHVLALSPMRERYHPCSLSTPSLDYPLNTCTSVAPNDTQGILPLLFHTSIFSSSWLFFSRRAHLITVRVSYHHLFLFAVSPFFRAPIELCTYNLCSPLHLYLQLGKVLHEVVFQNSRRQLRRKQKHGFDSLQTQQGREVSEGHMMNQDAKRVLAFYRCHLTVEHTSSRMAGTVSPKPAETCG